jgi:multiple sugar transport system ATP-binding protein
VRIGDRDVTGIAPQQRDLAMVFQSYALYPHKTVRENLAFALRIRRVDRAAIEDRVRRAAAALGIEDLLDRKPAQLSGGQRQRVALGRAIVREPQAFLLDEPLSNLDPQLRVATRTELAVLHRRLGATMVYVTHDQEEAMTLGTRVAVMRAGVIEQIAPPIDLFRQPANLFVAGFIGAPAMNLMQATAVRDAQGLRFSSPAFCVTDASGADALSHVARNEDGRDATEWPIVLGVRPQDVELTPCGHGHAVGRVELVELLGSTTVVHLRVEGLSDELLRIVVSSDAAVAADQLVGFRFDVRRLHLFDTRTGLRLA